MGEWIDDGVRFLIDGKMVTAEAAESAYPLDEKSQKNEAQRLKNMKEVRTLESDIAFHIQRSGDQPVEVGEAWKISPAMAVAMRLAGEMCDLVDLVDPKNTESYGTIYAGSDYWIVSPEYVNMLSNDPNKLWESATPEQFKENGKYNQISLLDDGRFFLTIIKPGAVESIPLQVDPEFVEPIREYLKKNPLNWDSANEGWKNGYNDLGGVYEFFRVIPLLRTAEVWIDLKWRGQHTNPVIEGGPFTIKDSAEISVRPVSYTETE